MLFKIDFGFFSCNVMGSSTSWAIIRKFVLHFTVFLILKKLFWFQMLCTIGFFPFVLFWSQAQHCSSAALSSLQGLVPKVLGDHIVLGIKLKICTFKACSYLFSYISSHVQYFVLFYFAFGVIPGNVQELFLDLCSGVNPEYAQSNICGARD